MTKDFKTQTTSGNSFGQYGLSWMLGGVAIGILAGLMMYALANKAHTPPTEATPPTTPATQATSPDTASAGTDANLAKLDSPAAMNTSEDLPRFSYHAVLPQLEVDVPASVQAANTQAPSEKKAPVKETVSKGTKQDTPQAATAKQITAEKTEAKPSPSKALASMNGFQIGSYKTEDQAAAMNSRLKKNGLNARVEKADVNGVAWFRVRIGPASSPEVLGKWQQTLSGMGISPLPVRM
jgi:cell division protein FtsN